MKKWKLKHRILFLAMFPVLVIAILLAAVIMISGVSGIDDALKARGMVIARQLAPASEYGAFSGNREILQALAQSVMKEEDVKAVIIADARNKILAVSGKPSQFTAGSTDAADSGHIIAGDKDGLIFGAPIYQSEIELDDFGLFDRTAHNKAEKKKIGRVFVEMSTASTQLRKKRFIAVSMAIGLFGLAGAFLLALRMSRDVTSPLFRLLDAVTRMTQGKLDARITADSGGELEELENGFNLMAMKLQSAHDTMQERIDEATSLLTHQASHDTLTGLVNRREFEARLQRALTRTHEASIEHALCYMDLDQFKIVNDTCGHVAGDELLRQLTLLMHDRVRDRDTLARLGGDEFGLLLENCQLDAARKIAEQLREMVADFRFVWHDKVFGIGVSIGLVPINHPTMTFAEIMSAADTACYAAKDGGRNRVQVYEAGNDALIQRQGEMQWVTRITEALEENRFLLYCQKIMPQQQSVEGEEIHEVLLRIAERDGKIIAPMAFIPAAVRYNLMPAIDRWVIKTAFGALRRLIGQGTPKSFIIKLSSASLGDPALLDFIRQQLSSPAILAQHVCFEITETAALIKLSETTRLITELKKTGCRFSLGDFGSGMSSFTYLKNLPVDYIKIDGTFVRDLLHDQVDYTIIKSIRNIGQAMGLKTIAGFVESEAIMAKLQSMGIHYAQGDWIGRPHPLDEL